jgi:hypothetical protein
MKKLTYFLIIDILLSEAFNPKGDNMETICQKTSNGLTVKIHPDTDPSSPREWDNVGTILYTSSRYNLGDKQVSSEEIKAIFEDKNNICLPVYAYIHGDITLNTTGFTCPWDSGQCGIIYVSKEKARKEFGRLTKKTMAKVLDNLKSEIKTFDQFLRGEVYGYTLEDSEGNEKDSCWGFLGYSSPEALAEEILNDNQVA